MSRPGLTYHDVAAAAQQLSAQGKNPTIESIRFLTGTGSSTTIAQHLKEWKARQDQNKSLPAKEKLPEEIVLSMKVLWDRVMTQAEEKLVIATQDFEQSTAELKQNYNKQREESVHWHQQYNEMKQERDQLAHDKLALEQAVRQLEDEKIALTVTQDSMSKQLQENKDRINELHRLNKQVQANLEHYYEASREQRMLDKQSYEQAQVQLEQTAKQLKQELIMLRNEKNLLDDALEREKLEKNTLQTQLDQLVSQSDIIKSDLSV